MILAIYVDFNNRERLPDGEQAVAIRIGRANPDALAEKLECGMKLILYDEDIRCDGVLRLGKCIDGWVADIVPASIRQIAPGEFERLRVQTKRAAMRVAR